jgi:hypothetical protein
MDFPSPRSFSPSANFRMICSGVRFLFFMAVLSSFPKIMEVWTRTADGSVHGDPVTTTEIETRTHPAARVSADARSGACELVPIDDPALHHERDRFGYRDVRRGIAGNCDYVREKPWF